MANITLMNGFSLERFSLFHKINTAIKKDYPFDEDNLFIVLFFIS